MTDFIPGLELSRLYYFEIVKPLLDRDFPGLQHSAALIGSGSEILGFDTEMSADHHWGPRVMIFLNAPDYDHYRRAIDETLRDRLPPGFRGYSTNFTPPDPNDNNTQLLQDGTAGSINHRIEILTIRGFLLDYIGFDIWQTIEPADWLTFPEQKLLTITAGAVYHDEVGLQTARDHFNYYPHEVWLFLLAASWTRVGQEEHLMGRAGLVGDEIGSAIIGSRLVRDLMRLCFLMEKQYAPYPKWFGTAFGQLKCAKALSPIFRSALLAETWNEREMQLSMAYEYVAEMHNELKITEPIPAKVTNFHGRPFKIIRAGECYADAIRGCLADSALKRIASRRLIGSIDQISDNTDILSDPIWRLSLRRLYE